MMGAVIGDRGMYFVAEEAALTVTTNAKHMLACAAWMKYLMAGLEGKHPEQPANSCKGLHDLVAERNADARGAHI